MREPKKRPIESGAPPKTQQSRDNSKTANRGFSEIWVAGYKSIAEEQRIEIRPLTILAGANSSGKSSIIQPLLLLKQTLEVGYDPGPLLLNGPNVKFTSASQLMTKTGTRSISDQFRVGMKIGDKSIIELSFKRAKEKGLSIEQMKSAGPDGTMHVLKPVMSHEQLMSAAPGIYSDVYMELLETARAAGSKRAEDTDESQPDEVPFGPWVWGIVRDRCFLSLRAINANLMEINDSNTGYGVEINSGPLYSTLEIFKSKIRKIIHVPGIRGNPERTYPVTAVGGNFPGLFQNYAASVIAQWQSTGKVEQLKGLEDDLKSLGLTWSISAKAIEDTEVELRVGRLGHREGEPDDMVNIADVGLAMSQVLPVIVALRTASPGQLVFIEQPELHLHPNAQIQLAGILANAANAGIQVLVETHSSLLLLAIQTLIAEDKFSPQDLKLHWFTRDDEGATRITSASVDERGAFGDWPEDFGDISLGAEHRYLTASEKKFQ